MIRNLSIAFAVIYIAAVNPTTIGSHSWEIERLQAAAIQVLEERKAEYIRIKEKWIHNLEMCESGGNNNAVNWYDKDGTASYYAFQFKPGTFRMYAERYKLINKGKSHDEIMQLLKRYDLQKSIVEQMVDDPRVKWRNEFPDCVRKYGLPPKFIE